VARSGSEDQQQLADVPVVYYTPETRVDCPDDEKFEVVARLRDYFSSATRSSKSMGAGVFEDGWGLVRASNHAARSRGAFRGDYSRPPGSH